MCATLSTINLQQHLPKETLNYDQIRQNQAITGAGAVRTLGTDGEALCRMRQRWQREKKVELVDSDARGRRVAWIQLQEREI